MLHAVVVAGEDQIDLPAWVTDFDSFRRWMYADEFPEGWRVCLINGTIWAGLRVESFFNHGQVKAEVTPVLHQLVKRTRYGRFAPDGIRYSHPDTELTTEPDGLIIASESFAAGRVTLVGAKPGAFTEVVGVPEVVIEIVSLSSEEKDTEWLMAAYHNAGIPEYWVIDARDPGGVRFDIHLRGERGYAVADKADGWVRSPQLGVNFRMVQTADEVGNPEFTLEVR
jgi:Uma2 family endonuclease